MCGEEESYEGEIEAFACVGCGGEGLQAEGPEVFSQFCKRTKELRKGGQGCTKVVTYEALRFILKAACIDARLSCYAKLESR